MKSIPVENMQSALPELEELLAEAGEVEITRDGKVIARILPPEGERRLPSHAAFRAKMPRMAIGSEVYIREDRDKR